MKEDFSSQKKEKDQQQDQKLKEQKAEHDKLKS
jgi:hypothetical protein